MHNLKLKHAFYLIDRILPRNVVRMPYSLAALIVKNKILNHGKCQVWFRNSYIKKRLVFGISDLDVTVMMPSFNLEKIKNIKNDLRKLKIFFPFLGETNFYIESDILEISNSLNCYERKRDEYLDKTLSIYNLHNYKVEKIVYLLRMLGSDRLNLIADPGLRQKKWANHFEEIGIEAPKFIDKDIIIEIIVKLIDDSRYEPSIRESLNFLFSPSASSSKVFQASKPFAWKFLFPHQYLWQEDLKADGINLIKDSVLKLICLRQIDWEVWGINSQLPFIDNQKSSISIHMGRLGRIASYFSDTSLSFRVNKLIGYSERYES